MDRTRELVAWLGSVGEEDLAALLRRRPDVLFGAEPRDLTDIAQRLDHVRSLTRALRTLPLPGLQVVEAGQALGGSVTRAALAGFLAGGGPDHQDQVDRVLDLLIETAVFTPDGEGRLQLPASVAELYPSPLRLGQPLYVLLNDCTVDALRRIQKVLGLERGGPKAELVTSLVAHLSKPDNVLAVLAGARPEVASYLEAYAGGADSDEELLYDRSLYALRQEAVRWGTERGLLVTISYGYDVHMPAEVARALRGPTYRAPFSPHRPEPRTRAVNPALVERDTAAAATGFADLVIAAVDRIAHEPLPCLKSGGIGSRELVKLAKNSGVAEDVVRLALELADAVGLLDRLSQTIVISKQFADWRDADPADRFVVLLLAWWRLGATPTQSQDDAGKARPALVRREECDGCRLARQGLVSVLAELDAATDRASIAATAVWQRPLVHIVDRDERAPFTILWREAEILGVIAQGALTQLGRLLLVDDEEGLRTCAARLLPTSADHASFGADLTVFVVGTPSGRVSALLDSAADRESRGGAVTWRFSPSSVRRAFDQGTTAEVLTRALQEIAGTELPQPLRYLIADVGRRHGNLRLTDASSCITSDDEPLLAEVVVDRRLAKLGLRLLAPTVLASDVPVDDLLLALRGAGYFPMSDVPAPEAEPTQTSRLMLARWVEQNGSATSRDASTEAKPADASAVAARLLSGGTAPLDTLTATERALSGLSRSLSAAEIRQLAHAVDTNGRVGIEYLSAGGTMSRRVIAGPELIGSSLYAWCELRGDDRVFTVSRVTSVSPV